MKKEQKELDNIKCDVCGYSNLKGYVQSSGVCHLCGNILDKKTYFKIKLNRKLRLWRDDRHADIQQGINRRNNK